MSPEPASSMSASATSLTTNICRAPTDRRPNALRDDARLSLSASDSDAPQASRRQQPTTDRHRHGQREAERRPVEGNGREHHRAERAAASDAQRRRRIHASQRAHTDPCHHHARRAADERKQQTLGEQQPNETPAPGADGQSHRDLAASSARACDQQICYVHASDEQHQRDRAEQHEQ